MKVNELRIENLVYDGFNAETIVCDITQTGINLNHGYSTISINELKPIPLTEEWLVKFGFVKHKTTDIYPTFAKQMFNWNDSILYIIGYGFMNHIKHVHQLQNLYFALTQTELVYEKTV